MTVKEIFSHHTKFARIAACLTLVVIMSVVAGFSKINKNIRIVADGQTTVVNTMNDNPASIISQAGIKLDPADEYSLSTKNINDGTTITIQRAVPVIIKVDDNTRKMKTTAIDVQALLKNMGYNLLDFYTLPNENAAITPNMLIRLEPLTNKIVFRDEDEPFNTVYQDDSTLPVGTVKVIQKGDSGIDRFMVKEYYNGGKKVDEQILQKSVIKQSVPEVVAKGTYSPADAASNGQIPPYVAMIHVQASAYLPTDGSGSGYTATGMPARRGVVAVDPNVIPLGTRLYIPGYGEAVAADTGGFSGNMIDICMESYTEAINWGRRNINIYILPN
ncbi:G5 domain-containing protein [Pectinatus haikarae]|uniref:3D (Asp-Asp-Asp) domain-containing protein n=1 Tax=Pectinatus haikarae TaxID=349096 RepID=A0ABT9YAD8_9FIRM|nr:G5 domain-containing protein [Pectinatus haikarae]MDQ0204801.1 3D (Asp-Asp-Asp) domain-containing protein [Pectinatus haikarae]